MQPVKIVEIFTDGACKGNPGIGGWGALLKYNGHTQELFGGEKQTTNNRMELLATIRALEALKRPCKVHLHTDSQYVQKGISEWISGWKQRGWQTANKKTRKKTQTFGNNWIFCLSNTKSSGSGFADMPVMPVMNLLMR